MTAVTLLALDLTFLLVGLAALYGLGLVRSMAAGLRLAGLALLVGWSLLGVAGSFALMLGSALGLGTLLGLAAALAAVGPAAARRVPAADGSVRWPATLPRVAAGGAGALVVVVVFVELFRRARLLAGAWEWDAWAFWIPKAEAIVYRGGIGTGPGSFSSFANPDYPPFVPATDAMVFRLAGTVDPGMLGAQRWVLGAAFVAALAGLLWHRVAPEILLPGLAVIAALPAFDDAVSSLLAEGELVVALGLAAAAGLLWLLERDPRHAALFAVFAAALVLTKNEGFFFALLLGLLLAALSFRSSTRIAALLVGAPLLAMLPWKLWLRLNDVPANPYYTASDLVRPARTIDQAARLRTTLADLPGYYLHFSRSLVVLPVVLALAALLWRRRRGAALVGISFLAIAFLGNATVYWISNVPLRWYIDTSAERTSTGPIVFAAVLLPILAAEALGSHRAAPTGRRRSLRRSPRRQGGALARRVRRRRRQLVA